MLNKIWLFFILAACVSALFHTLTGSEIGTFEQVLDAAMSMAKLSVEIALGLIGVLAFWLGMFNIAEKAGLIQKVSIVLEPLLIKLMPDLPKGHKVTGSITMNMSANILGLDNAATPFGIKAMQDMQELNNKKDSISNSQIMFLVLNTSSVTLFPIAVFLYRAEQGAAQPTDVFIPILLATSASTLVGVCVASWMNRVNIFNRTIFLYFFAGFSLLAAIGLYFSQLVSQQMADQSSLLANSLLVAFIVWVLFSSYRRNQNSYELFIEGAKKGFELAISLIPYLLAMLFAIGMFRASGLMDAMVNGLAYLVEFIGMDTRFTEALPNAFMKPLSGSGARAMMIETMQTHGADSFAGRLASVMQGSTETTFYVLAVYLGAVGIKYTRHAISACLAADVAGLTTAILVSYWFFA